MVHRGLRAVAAGAGPMAIKRGIDAAVEAVTDRLLESAKPVDEKSAIASVAAALPDAVALGLFLSPIPYVIVAVVGVIRSANNCPVQSFWTAAVKVAVIIWAIATWEMRTFSRITISPESSGGLGLRLWMGGASIEADLRDDCFTRFSCIPCTGHFGWISVKAS
jgi:hypothetical protein